MSKTTQKPLKTETLLQNRNNFFLNVPCKGEEEAMTQFLPQYAVVLGKPRYTIENIDDIDYLTGTRIYKVHSRKEHIPRQITLFGRQIQCIYTKQPEQQAWIEKQKQEQERKNRDSLNPDNNIESDHGNRNSDNEIEAEQNDQKPDIVTEPEQDNQKYIEKQNNTDNKTLKTNMNQTTSRIKYDLPR